MDVKENLKVNADVFFDTLAESILYDISQALETPITMEQITPEYIYVKKMKNKLGQQGDVHVTIQQFLKPELYEASFQSTQGVNHISYKITDLHDGSIEVEYHEDFDGKNTSGSLNYKLFSSLYQHSAKKRVTRMLHSMETYIQHQHHSVNL